MERLLDAKETACRLGVKLSTIYSWVSRRQIPHVKVRGSLRFRPSALEAWLERHEGPAASGEAGR